jgi:hypothetical protein
MTAIRVRVLMVHPLALTSQNGAGMKISRRAIRASGRCADYNELTPV